mmetsp:Transcript_32089/g.42564  ORF Transcript_32089/g.42564 Transcript_32089/m.42564 type:complete len:85 (+) Transcript_32089:74-328(+)
MPKTSSTLGRTNTGFSSSTNFSNSKHTLATNKHSSNNSGVVLLHDMADRSKVQLVGKTKPKQLVSAQNRNERSQLTEVQLDPKS